LPPAAAYPTSGRSGNNWNDRNDVLLGFGVFPAGEQIDWPPPRTARVNQDQSWSNRNNALLAPTAMPPGQFNWPSPRAPRYSQDNSWTNTNVALLATPAAPVVEFMPPQFEYPLPPRDLTPTS